MPNHCDDGENIFEPKFSLVCAHSYVFISYGQGSKILKKLNYICDWLWQNLSFMHKGKYLEIIIEFNYLKCKILTRLKAVHVGLQIAMNL